MQNNFPDNRVSAGRYGISPQVATETLDNQDNPERDVATVN
jgi:hypothetical protein